MVCSPVATMRQGAHHALLMVGADPGTKRQQLVGGQAWGGGASIEQLAIGHRLGARHRLQGGRRRRPCVTSPSATPVNSRALESIVQRGASDQNRHWAGAHCLEHTSRRESGTSTSVGTTVAAIYCAITVSHGLVRGCGPLSTASRLRWRMSPEFRAARAAFLGIERSLTGRRWAARLADERTALAMAQRHGLPDAICRLLAAREVDLEGVPDFLEPTCASSCPIPRI